MFNPIVIEAALGKRVSDLLLTNCRIIDVFSSSILEGDIAIYSSFIVGINDDLSAKEKLDLKGAYVSPGFIDSHVHIESSLLPPPEYAYIVAPKGTTSVIADPHEIANVLGYEGIKFMISSSKDIPINVFFMMSSCVPATNLDTSGASIYASDMYQFKKEDTVKGLAEVMDFHSVINKVPQLMDKIALFSDMTIDGHAPQLQGKELSAYISAGIGSDHECTSFKEAKEKLSKGMYIMIREGSTARDLESLFPIISEKTRHRLLLCTDDKDPDDLYYEGHIDFILRKLIKRGVDPLIAIQMATLNPAVYFDLKRYGAIAPGFYADLVVFNDLQDIRAEIVFKKGELVAREGKLLVEKKPLVYQLKDTVNIKRLSEDDFKIPDRNKKVRIIKALENSLITQKLIDYVPVRNGYLESDTEKDYLKIFVIERHYGSGNIGKGFINGLGLRKGAIGSTISHDSHNMIIVGVDDISIFKAAKHLNKVGGGLVITEGNKIIEDLPLPIAGLMSDKDVMFVLEKLKKYQSIFKSLKTRLGNPFMALSFLALCVIPSLKITDQGLIDVDNFKKLSLYVD